VRSGIGGTTWRDWGWAPIDAMEKFGILQAYEVAELIKLHQSTVLDLSRRGTLPAFKIGSYWPTGGLVGWNG
jgi:hypothetical protein